MNTNRLVIKKTGGRYTHTVYFIGVSSLPLAYVNKTDYGYQVFDLEGNGKGLHDSRERAKLAVIEHILSKR